MENTTVHSHAKGELVMRTIAMPAHANYNGDIFGGWVVAEMDICGGVIATRHAKNKVTTVAIDKINFTNPVKQGDLVSFYAAVEKIGNTSITLKLDVWVLRNLDQKEFKVTEGTFVYVAIDKNGNPCSIK